MPLKYALRGAALGWGQHAGVSRRAKGATLSLRAYRVYKDIPAPPASHHVTKSIVCFRHGDRSASHNLFEPESELAVQEALAWSLELPTKAQEKQLHQLAPVERTENTLLPRDAELGVFGKLTVRGIEQAQKLGEWLRRQYIAKKTLPRPNQEVITCYSSNYSRTIMSAQSVLQAMLGRTLLDGNKVKVKVCSQEHEFINVYPFLQRLQKLMYDAANRADGPIVSADNAMVATRDALSNMLPAFSFNLRRFSWLTFQDHYHCRLGRTWPHAAAAESTPISRIKSLFDESDVGNDTYLTKSETRQLLRKLSDYVTDEDCDKIFETMDTNDNEIVTYEEFVAFCQKGFPLVGALDKEEAMWSSRGAVERHVVKRFEAWYGSEEILHHAIGRLVRRINTILLDDGDSEQSNIVHNTGALDSTTRVTLVSGHDITVMPLLYAVGDWKEGEDDWPNYTSTVVFELLEPTGTGKAAEDEDSLEVGTKYVRGFYYPGVLSKAARRGTFTCGRSCSGTIKATTRLARAESTFRWRTL